MRIVKIMELSNQTESDESDFFLRSTAGTEILFSILTS